MKDFFTPLFIYFFSFLSLSHKRIRTTICRCSTLVCRSSVVICRIGHLLVCCRAYTVICRIGHLLVCCRAYTVICRIGHRLVCCRSYTVICRRSSIYKGLVQVHSFINLNNKIQFAFILFLQSWFEVNAQPNQS